MPHVFISYSRKDTAFVEKLEHDLNARGIVTWRDKSNIPPGSLDWHNQIADALEDAFAVALVVTPNSDESRWVAREILYADEVGVPVIPVLPTDYHPQLNLRLIVVSAQVIRFDDPDYEVGLVGLVAALHTYRERPQRPAPVSPTEQRMAETRYLDFLLAETKADLKTARYVSLSAERERPAARQTEPAKPAWDYFPDEDELIFRRVVDVERVCGEDFDRPGDPIPDARLPLREMKRVILLGEPGSGKTTTLLQLAIDLAREAKTALETGSTSPMLPVFLPLRSYSGEEPFGEFVRKRLFTLQSQYERLLAGGRLVLLCDALNEMPRIAHSEGRADGRDLVAEVRGYLRERQLWVVSCRVRDYQEELKGLPGVGKVRLKPLDLPRIKDVIDRRFSPDTGAEPGQAAALWADLKGSENLLVAWQELDKADFVDVFWGPEWPNVLARWYNDKMYPLFQAHQAMHADPRRMMLLCRSPYMLFMVCSTFERAGKLPANRGALFADFVENLLSREERTSRTTGRAWIDAGIIRRALAQLAYAMQTSESGTEITRTEAGRILAGLPEVVDPALLLRLAGAASLLDVGESVRYTHQLLQEYYASEVMGGVMDEHRPAAQFWPPDRWWEPQGWEETALILAGVRGDPEGVARWIAPAQPEIAYRVLTDCGIETDLEHIAPETRAALVASARDKTGEANSVGRAAAYRVLGRFRADERPHIGLRADGVPDIDWVEIPGGEFIYQDNERRHLSTFHISRHSITYLQFQAFIDDPEGFHDARWGTGLDLPERHNDAPGDQAFKFWNHPRERVSWYDAMAFCRWLSWRLGGGWGLDAVNDWAVRLPTEFEWEKAARGADGRIYPYGDTFDASKGNIDETGIRRTSAVGIFPDGASPYGVLDMSGNVWEWCLTDYDDPALDASSENLRSISRRVLRGGSWGNFLSSARCVYRYGDPPGSRSGSIGFRLVRPASL